MAVLRTRWTIDDDDDDSTKAATPPDDGMSMFAGRMVDDIKSPNIPYQQRTCPYHHLARHHRRRTTSPTNLECN